MKILAFEIEVGGIRSIVDDMASLRAAVKQTNTEFSQAKRGTTEYQRLGRQLGALKTLQRDFNADIREQGRRFVVAADEGRRSYRALNAELVNLRAQFKELSEEDRQSRLGRGLIRQIQALDRELKEIDASIGNYQRNVGNYRKALVGIGDLVTGGLLTGGIQSVFNAATQAATDAIRVTADFGRQMSIVGQVSGASADQLERLRTLALELGSTTEFTASQVAGLQLEYSKLGFSAQEIEDILPNALDAATVSQESLQDTARVTGAAIRAFGLDATQSGTLIDTLAKSFASSALDLTKFEVALQQVGAVATSTGVPFQQVIGQLGQLVNNGFDASVAATSLRNIYLELSGRGLDLEETLVGINEATDPLVASFELFGKRGAAAGVVLAQQAEQTQALIATLNAPETTGFARQAADVIRKDLQGSFESLSSAVEGLKLAFVGTFGEALQAGVDRVTAFVRTFTDFIQGGDSFKDLMADIRQVVVELTPAMIALTTAIALNNRQMIISAVQSIPQFITGLVRGGAITRTFAAAQTALNIIMRSNPIGLVITAIGLLITALTAAYNRSETFRRVIAGLSNTASEVFAIIGESVKAFVDGFNSIREGDVLGGLQAIGRGIVKGNPVNIAFFEGERLKNAFNEGYESVEVDTDTTAEELERGVSELGDRGASAATDAGNLTGEALNQALDAATANTLNTLNRRKKEITDNLADLDPDSQAFRTLSEELRQVDGEITRINQRIQGGATPAFQQLTNLQSALTDQIRNAIITGQDYSGLLDQLVDVTGRISEANAEYAASVDPILAGATAAAGSVRILEAEVQALNAQLQEADPGSIQGIAENLVQAEQRLAAAKLEIERATTIALQGASTGVLQADIDQDIQDIERLRQARLLAVREQFSDEGQLRQQQAAINLASDIDAITQQTRLYREGTEERLALENELAQKRAALSAVEEDIGLDSRIEAIERSTFLQIAANREIEQSTAEMAANRKVIELTGAQEIAEARLALETLNENERLALVQQIADRELEIEDAKNAALLEKRRLLSEQSAQVLSEGLEILSSVPDIIGAAQEAQLNREIAGIEARYDREIELAEGNEQEQERLAEERDATVEQIEREAFERSKRLQIAAAGISLAQGIVNVLSAPTTIPDPFGTIFKAARIATITASTVAQIASIRSASFAEGGYTGKSRFAPDHTGHRPAGVVHEDEYVTPKWVLATPEGRYHVGQLEAIRNRRPVRHQNFGYYAEGGLVGAAITPRIENPVLAVNTSSETTISTEQMLIFGEIVASAVGSSMKDATTEAEREKELARLRNERLKQITG